MKALVLICGLARASVFAAYGAPTTCVETPRGETCSWRAPNGNLRFVQFCGTGVCGAWEWRTFDRFDTLTCQVKS